MHAFVSRETHWGWGMRLMALAIGSFALLLGLGMLPAAQAATHPHTAPAPFLYRPYYGTATVLSRSISLFDHDHPDYTSDGIFVRYDGQTFQTGGATGCQPYVTCYDGHNGYDLNLYFEPVLAAGSGTVIRAGWFNPANHLDGGGLWVAIDHGNGYVTMYCHLSAVLVQVGQVVQAQWQIGTSGSTGSATGPHLHFSAFQMPNWVPMDPFGWRGSTPDPNAVPDYYLWVSAPQSPTQAPCLACGSSAIAAGATVVTNDSAGFHTTGTWQTATTPGTIGPEMRWTYTTSGSATATATWQPALPTAGAYEIGVYIDPANTGSQWAGYTITSVDPATGQAVTRTTWIDQQHIGTFQNAYGTISTGPQWVSLGTYIFNAGAWHAGAGTLEQRDGGNGRAVGRGRGGIRAGAGLAGWYDDRAAGRDTITDPHPAGRANGDASAAHANPDTGAWHAAPASAQPSLNLASHLISGHAADLHDHSPLPRMS